MPIKSLSEIEQPTQQVVVIIGLGYVGLTLAVHLLENGCKVYGVEIRPEILDALEHGESPFHEPRLKELVQIGIESNLFFFSSEVPILSESCTFIITVGTPLDENFSPNMTPISRAAKQVQEKIKDGDLVILRSTVLLGTTKKIVLPILELSGKKFFLSFCPERTVEGKALEELKYLPQIIGGVSPDSTIAASNFFKAYTEEIVPVSSTETAELIKLVDNMQRDAQFAISNEIALISTLYGVRAREVIQKGKLNYPRTNLPSPGPVGGPCLEKDSWILASSLSQKFADDSIAIAARRTNLNVIDFGVTVIKDFILKSFKLNPVISVLGLAFKGVPETDDLRGSPSIQLIRSILKEIPTATVVVWDPVVENFSFGDSRIGYGSGLYESSHGADVVILMNNHPIFSSLSPVKFGENTNQISLLYDFWDRFEKEHFREGFSYLAWGFHE
jgi:nucleotide sugar dehydrogenase